MLRLPAWIVVWPRHLKGLLNNHLRWLVAHKWQRRNKNQPDNRWPVQLQVQLHSAQNRVKCVLACELSSEPAFELLESGWVLVPPLEVLGGAALELLLRKVHGRMNDEERKPDGSNPLPRKFEQSIGNVEEGHQGQRCPAGQCLACKAPNMGLGRCCSEQCPQHTVVFSTSHFCGAWQYLEGRAMRNSAGHVTTFDLLLLLSICINIPAHVSSSSTH
jgi:hypothetical protein